MIVLQILKRMNNKFKFPCSDIILEKTENWNCTERKHNKKNRWNPVKYLPVATNLFNYFSFSSGVVNWSKNWLCSIGICRLNTDSWSENWSISIHWTLDTFSQKCLFLLLIIKWKLILLIKFTWCVWIQVLNHRLFHFL